MTTGNWIAVFGIIVSAVVAFAATYMQRKQARQIELHRLDPDVPLKPPLHPITRFLKTYWDVWWYIVFECYMIFQLVQEVRETTPIDRRTIFQIAFDVSGFLLGLLSLGMVLLLHLVHRIGTANLLLLKEAFHRIVKLEERRSSTTDPPEVNSR